jgi:hypothetical protein
MRSTSISYDVPEDLILLRVTSLHGPNVVSLQALDVFQVLRLLLALQNSAPLLPYPLMRISSTPNRASLPTLTTTVSSIIDEKVCLLSTRDNLYNPFQRRYQLPALHLGAITSMPYQRPQMYEATGIYSKI